MVRESRNGGEDILYVGLVTGNGGDAVQMLELASGMAARGPKVRIVVPSVETTLLFAQQCRERGIPVERTSRLRVDILGARQNPLDVVQLFRSHRAGILHLHTGNDCLPRTVLLAMGLLRLPRAFVTVHSPYTSLTEGDARARAWATAAPRRFRTIICPSERSLKAQLRYGLPVELLKCIKNGVDVERFATGNGLRIRTELGLGPETPLIVFTSRLDPQKRPLDVIEAFSRVAADFPEAQLALVGTGALEQEAKIAVERAGLASRVHFPGYRTDVRDWLAAATLWTMPTESENFSIAIIEALAAGCPVLTTWCSGNDEILVDDHNALTFAVGDVNAMTQGLRRLLSSPDLRARLTSAARLTAQEYTLDRMVAAYVGCYTQDSESAV
jgi:glycosyltransferase involved in cell wall biosynthesis